MPEKIKYSQSLLRSMMESPDHLLIWALDRDYKYLFFNNSHKKKMKQFWGADIELGKSVLSYISDADYREAAKSHYERVLTDWSGVSLDELVDSDGQVRYFDNYGNPIYDKNKKIVGLVLYTMEVTQRVKAVKELEKLSVTDNLTGLYNRARIDSFLIQEISRRDRYKHPCCLLLIDIDFFKKINDNFGHLAGDDILVQFSKLLQENIRETDACGRWGGEEFLIILPETGIGESVQIAEKIRGLVESFTFAHDIRCTCSIGVAEHKEKENLESLLQRTDNAMYKAKRLGRNRVVVDSSS